MAEISQGPRNTMSYERVLWTVRPGYLWVCIFQQIF